jgi:glyoxylase-like metal-dependent hydrolase (beta-lactamase superfamily II)
VLRQVAEGVLIHESEFCQSNAVVVHGRAGVLLIDPGVDGYEMACLAHDLSDSGQTVMAGFSTHPHWDHLLWHARLGAAPRYGTARCAATARDLAAGAARRDQSKLQTSSRWGESPSIPGTARRFAPRSREVLGSACKSSP